MMTRCDTKFKNHCTDKGNKMYKQNSRVPSLYLALILAAS